MAAAACAWRGQASRPAQECGRCRRHAASVTVSRAGFMFALKMLRDRRRDSRECSARCLSRRRRGGGATPAGGEQKNELAAQHAGRLTTHVLDTATGGPAAGLQIELFRHRRRRPRTAAQTVHHQRRRPLRRARCCRAPELDAGQLRAGVPCRRLSARRRRRTLPDPPFLDLVPIRFGIAATRPALPRAAAGLALRLLDLPRQLTLPSHSHSRQGRPMTAPSIPSTRCSPYPSC